MTPRLATHDDLDAVQAIADAAYAPYVARIGRKPAPMVADFAGHLARDELWIAPPDGPPQAYVVLIPGSDHVLLDNIAVAQPGQGLGGQVMAWVETWAQSHHLHRIRLYTNAKMTENLRIYPHLGYKETHRVTEDGFDRVYFEKHLP